MKSNNVTNFFSFEYERKIKNKQWRKYNSSKDTLNQDTYIYIYFYMYVYQLQ